MSDHARARRSDGGPPERAQRNFTNRDSRVLKTRDGFVQGYNGQLAVDAAHQIIVAQRLTTSGRRPIKPGPRMAAMAAKLKRAGRRSRNRVRSRPSSR